jgi:hypothetical protein
MSTGYYTHPSFLMHEMGHFHPECPERLQAIEDHLISHGMDGLLDRRRGAGCHRRADRARTGPEYVASLVAMSPATGYHPIDPDTLMNPHTLTAARHAAGAAVAATDAVIAGELRTRSAARVRRAIMPSPIARWDSVSSITWRLRRDMRSRRTACRAWRSSISMCTTATAPRRLSATIRRC